MHCTTIGDSSPVPHASLVAMIFKNAESAGVRDPAANHVSKALRLTGSVPRVHLRKRQPRGTRDHWAPTRPRVLTGSSRVVSDPGYVCSPPSTVSSINHLWIYNQMLNKILILSPDYEESEYLCVTTCMLCSLLLVMMSNIM